MPSSSLSRRLHPRWVLLAGLACSAAMAGAQTVAPAATTLSLAHASHATTVTQAIAPLAITDFDSGSIKTGRPFANPPIIQSRRGKLEMKLVPRSAAVDISGKRVNARVFAMSAFGKPYAATRGPRCLYDAKMERLKA